MKFINAKFFYESSKLINETKYSYWWVLMGNLKTYGEGIEKSDSTGISDTEFTTLKEATVSYNIVDSSSVTLNNVYICGIAGAASAPVIAEGETENKGTVVLTASGSNADSIIPFTVGQNYSEVGHEVDSLWLLALDSEVTNSDLFAFETSGSADMTTQKYIGATYDISDSEKCIPLIGYSVKSDNAVNSINYSGFTVGSSTVTLSGLMSE